MLFSSLFQIQFFWSGIKSIVLALLSPIVSLRSIVYQLKYLSSCMVGSLIISTHHWRYSIILIKWADNNCNKINSKIIVNDQFSYIKYWDLQLLWSKRTNSKLRREAVLKNPTWLSVLIFGMITRNRLGPSSLKMSSRYFLNKVENCRRRIRYQSRRQYHYFKNSCVPQKEDTPQTSSFTKITQKSQ